MERKTSFQCCRAILDLVTFFFNIVGPTSNLATGHGLSVLSMVATKNN